MKIIAVLALSVACLVSSGSYAADVKGNSLKTTLAAVAAGEMPAKAADMVKRAKARDWGTTTINVVKAALEVNPAAAPAVVGAIAKAVPEMASIAAGTAAELQPQQADAIAKAAAAAAPGRAYKIVLAVCRAVPAQYRAVATAVSQVAPDSSKDILKAVATALPETKSSVDRLLVGYAGSVPVAQVISQVAPTAPSSTVATANPLSVRGPSQGPPFVSGPPSSTGVKTNTSNSQVSGGRDYTDQ